MVRCASTSPRSGVDLAQLKHVQEFESGLGGRLDLKASGAAKIVNGLADLTSLNGQLSVRNAMLDGRTYGNLDGHRGHQTAGSHAHRQCNPGGLSDPRKRRMAHGRRLSRRGSRANPAPLVRHAPRSVAGQASPQRPSFRRIHRRRGGHHGSTQSAVSDESRRDAFHGSVQCQAQRAPPGRRPIAGSGV